MTAPQQLRLLSVADCALEPGEIGVDGYAGGGGWSTGFEWATGVPPAIAFNHDENAIAMHTANHPETEHHPEDAFAIIPRNLTRGRRVGWAHFSPDCTDFSRAKGGKPLRKKIRGLAWVVLTWAHQTAPRIISLENVSEFQGWGPLNRTGQRIKKRAGETFRAFVACLTTGLAADHPAWKEIREALVTNKRRKKVGISAQDFEEMVPALRRGLGYQVEWRVLNAADFGAPTSRKRLFILARRDGRPIRWPMPTHGPRGTQPYHTAAECIDWTIKTHSIFLSKAEARALGVKRPLVNATLRRVAAGVMKFVVNAKKPYLVRYHAERRPGETPRVESIDNPLPTQTVGNRFAVVEPHLVNLTHGARSESLDEPMLTITGAHRGEKALVAPIIARTAHGEEGKNGSKRWGHGAHEVGVPLPTVTGSNDFALIAPTLIQTSYGERQGQAPRVLDLQEPLGTVVAGGTKHSLVAALLSKGYGGHLTPGCAADAPIDTITTQDHHHLVEVELVPVIVSNYGESLGSSVEAPLPTVTAGGGGHSAIAAAHITKFRENSIGSSLDEPLPTVTSGAGSARPAGAAHALGVVGAHMTKFNGTSKDGASIDEPLHTVTTGGGRGGGHHGLAAVFLAKYYGEGGQWQGLDVPLHTVPTVDRFALVAAFLEKFVPGAKFPDGIVKITVDGETYAIYDIGIRMLVPRELATAQGFPKTYVLIGTKTQQVARIGNSLPPHYADALVSANLSPAGDGDAEEAAA